MATKEKIIELYEAFIADEDAAMEKNRQGMGK
jgi:hypothetical protein